MIDLSFLRLLDRFSLIIRKRITSNYVGPKRSIAVGRGITFKDYRPYASGDDFRSIDWKVYARTDHLYVKTYEEERNFVVHVLIDCSASMNYGKPNKFDYGAMIGVGFAYLAIKDNEKFQFATFADSMHTFQPKRGMSHLLAMVQHLNDVKKNGYSKIFDSVMQYKKNLGTKSLIVIVSDLLINIDEIKKALYMLGDHEIKVIQVLDRSEVNLGIKGDLDLKDSESGSKLRTYISPRLKTQYEHMLDDHAKEIEKTCNDLGISFFQITTDTALFDAFYKILE